jgi:hypothetical protein
MDKSKLTLVWKAYGYMDAQLVKNYLESFGLQVYDFEESVGKAYGLTTTPLGEVELYVPNAQKQDAEKYLQQYCDAQNEES